MKTVFIGEGFFAFRSNAASNLIYAFAHGFQENGCHSILLPMGNEYCEPRGFIGLVEYYVPLAQKTRNPNYFIRNYHKSLKYLKAIQYVRSLHKNKESSTLICFSASIPIIVFSFFLKMLFFDHSFIFIGEHPLRVKKWYNRFLFPVYKSAFSIFFDGQIFMSEGLKKYFKTRKKNLIVPSMVFLERFDIQHERPFLFEYIGYCGTITRIKDGVHILIQGFEKISHKYPTLKLLIIGDFSNENEKLYFDNLIRDLKLMDQVIFTGKIPKNDMSIYLNNAKILALARPTNLQSETGFPTKLPEYLSTGKPVVFTKVGDIPKYLSNNENAFLVEPDDVDAISTAFDSILSNYEKALVVAREGQLLTQTIFNPRFQAARVINFIQEEISTRK